MNDQILDSRKSWTRLGITLAIASIGNVGMWAIIAIMPAVAAEFEASRAVVSLPYTVTMIGFALGSVIAGRFVDRHGIMRTLMIAGISSAAAFALAAMAPSIWVMILAQGVLGLGTATCFGPLMADISHWFLKRRGLAVAIAACGNYLSGAIWPYLLAGLLETQGWRAVYFALSGISLVTMLPLAWMLRAEVGQAARDVADRVAAANQAKVLFHPQTLTILLIFAGIGCCMAMAMPQVHIVSLSVDLGCGAHAGVRMLSLMLLGGVISRLVSGMMADRIGGLKILLIGSVLQCIALFLYLPASTEAQLYAVSLIFGLSQGGIVPSYAIIVREYMPSREAGTRTGLVVMATIIGMALGGWVSGLIHDLTGSYRLAFINGIGWNFLNIAIIAGLLLVRRRRNFAI